MGTSFAEDFFSLSSLEDLRRPRAGEEVLASLTMAAGESNTWTRGWSRWLSSCLKLASSKSDKVAEEAELK